MPRRDDYDLEDERDDLDDDPDEADMDADDEGESSTVRCPYCRAAIYERMIRENGVLWPCLTEEDPGTAVLFTETFPRGLGLFHPAEWAPAKELPEPCTKKAGDVPDELTIRVDGVKQVTLVVDYGNFMQILGRGDWADAHLVK